jgi:hypothetical protein
MMPKIKIKQTEYDSAINLINELEDLLEKANDKPLCSKKGMNANHDADGRFSSKADAKSWSVRTVDSSKTACKKGQRSANPSRWVRIRCGRKDAKNPDIKAKYRCKDGSEVNESGLPDDYKDCILNDLDKKYKTDSKTGEEHIEVDKKFKCKPKPVQFDPALNQDLETMKRYEENFDDDGKICVAYSVFQKYLKFIDQQPEPEPSNVEEPLEEKDKHGKLNRNEYVDTIMPGWRAFKSLANGVY